MAKNLSFTRSLVDKFTVKGLLSEDGKTITYINEDKDETIIPVDKCLHCFKGRSIELTIAEKQNMDLGDGSEEE